MTTPNTDSPTAAASAPAAPPASQSAGQVLLDHIKSAERAELDAVKPLIGQIVRQFVSQYEAKLSGVTGIIERRVIDSIVDAIFGPATS